MGVEPAPVQVHGRPLVAAVVLMLKVGTQALVMLVIGGMYVFNFNVIVVSVNDFRIGNGGGSSFSQGGAINDSRYRRDDERDRTRNLPNRFRKRNEERTGGTEDKPTVDKEKSTGNNRPVRIDYYKLF